MDKYEYNMLTAVSLAFAPAGWYLSGDIFKGLTAGATVYVTYIFYSMVWEGEYDV